MDRRIFALCDQDPEFVFRFMDFARRRLPVSMDMRAFTDREHLRALCETTPPELLLVCRSAAEEGEEELQAGVKVLLLEEEPEIPGVPSVYKYQPPEQLLEKVLGFCEKKREKPSLGQQGKGLEIIGVYSPVGRSRKTSFALAMGQILAGSRAVLYLNLETFAGFEELFAEKYDRTLSDLLYFARQKEIDLGDRLTGIREKLQNLDYVPPVLCPEDLQEIRQEEWLELFERLEQQTGYEVLLLDLGESVRGLTGLLAACHRIYMPVRKDPLSQAKIRQFLRVLEEMQGKAVSRRIRQVSVPLCQNSGTGKAFFEELVRGEMGELVCRELAEGAGNEG